MKFGLFGAWNLQNWSLWLLLVVCSVQVPKSFTLQNITANTNYASTTILPSPSTANTTNTPPITLPTTIASTTTKASTTPYNTQFTPEKCEQQFSEGDDIAPIQFLSFKPVYITQERATVKLNCNFCVTKATEWASISWYKDNKLIENDVDTLFVNRARLSHHDEGMYRCDVVTSTNHTASRTMTLIINKDPEFSMIPTVWARNLSYTQATKVLWQIRGGGIFNAVHITIKLRRLDQQSWLYTREYNQFISGSTEFYSLEPSTLYIANVTAVASDGGKAECRSIAFWSNARNSTEFDSGILNLDYCTRQLLGLITGMIGLLCAAFSIYCCCFNPACEYTNLHGQTTFRTVPTQDSVQQKYDSSQEERDWLVDVDFETRENTHLKV